MYCSPSTPNSLLEEVLNEQIKTDTKNFVIVGDFNARTKNWCRATNRLGKALSSWALRRTRTKIEASLIPSHKIKPGARKSGNDTTIANHNNSNAEPKTNMTRAIDLALTNIEVVNIITKTGWRTQVSDHFPVVFKVKMNPKELPPVPRIPRTRLNNQETIENANQHYDVKMPDLYRRIRQATEEEAQSLHTEAEEVLKEPFRPTAPQVGQKPLPWWNFQVEWAKKKAIKAASNYKRAKNERKKASLRKVARKAE